MSPGFLTSLGCETARKRQWSAPGWNLPSPPRRRSQRTGMRNPRRSAVNAELQIGNDPATWYLPSAGYDMVAAALAQPGAPFAVEVIAPLQGRLLLNPVAAGAVSLTLPVRPIGWNPSGVVWPESPLLYVSSATAPTHADPGYALARGYQLDVLEQEILTA